VNTMAAAAIRAAAIGASIPAARLYKNYSYLQ